MTGALRKILIGAENPNPRRRGAYAVSTHETNLSEIMAVAGSCSRSRLPSPTYLLTCCRKPEPDAGFNVYSAIDLLISRASIQRQHIPQPNIGRI